MFEVIKGFSEIPFWSKFADLHGMFSMLSLIFFGGAFVFYFFSTKTKEAVGWLKKVLGLLLVDITLLEIFGLTVYIPYRAKGGAKFELVGSENTAWLHEIVFEHKEFLAFAPLLMTLAAYLIVVKAGENFGDPVKFKWLRLSVLASLIISLIFVLIVAAEAVLVTKAAPVGGR